MIDRRWHSELLDVRIFSAADSDTDQYLVVAKVREKLAESKQAARRFDWECLNLRKLNELAIRRKYEIEITKSFAALENLNNDEDINRAWENIKENFKTSTKQNLGLNKWKQHKPCFREECLGFFRSKEAG